MLQKAAMRIRSSLVRAHFNLRDARDLIFTSKTFELQSTELNFAARKNKHAEQKQTVLPSINVGRSVNSFIIAYRYLHDLQIEFGGSEEKIKIAERIKITEFSSVSCYTSIVF